MVSACNGLNEARKLLGYQECSTGRAKTIRRRAGIIAKCNRPLLHAESPSPDVHQGSRWKGTLHIYRWYKHWLGPYVVPLQPSAKHREKWHSSLFKQFPTSNGATDSAKPRHAASNGIRPQSVLGSNEPQDASFEKPQWMRANKQSVDEGQGKIWTLRAYHHETRHHRRRSSFCYHSESWAP